MLNLSKTVRAESVDKAIEAGLKQLGIRRDEAEIHVISEGKKGFLGLGRQDAIVEVRRLNDKSYKEMTQELEAQQSGEGSQEASPLESVEPAPEAVRPVVEAQAEDSEPVLEEPIEVQEPEPGPNQATKDPSPEAEGSQASAASGDRQAATSTGLSLEESIVKASAYLKDIIEHYGASATVHTEVDGRQIFFDIDTDKSGLVIGKHGKIINSLQILTQTYFLSIHHQHKIIILNVGDYRKRRANVLYDMAMDAADEAIASRQPVILDRLPAYERKQIHAHLSKLSQVKTHSEGREPHRRLVVEHKEDPI